MNTDIAQLQEKIRGKMEVAKFFAGFISVVFGFLLKEVLGMPDTAGHCVAMVFAYIAIFCFIASLTLSIATVFAYDRLLMPVMFWTTPPSPDQLRCEMVWAWSRLFVPTVCALVVGLLASIIAVTNSPWICLMVWVIPVGGTYFMYHRVSSRIPLVD